jgi:hypothetical protein
MNDSGPYKRTPSTHLLPVLHLMLYLRRKLHLSNHTHTHTHTYTHTHTSTGGGPHPDTVPSKVHTLVGILRAKKAEALSVGEGGCVSESVSAGGEGGGEKEEGKEGKEEKERKEQHTTATDTHTHTPNKTETKFRAIVFVQQRIVCRVLYEYLSTLPDLRGKCGFITGQAKTDGISGYGARGFKETMDAFVRGEVEVGFFVCVCLCVCERERERERERKRGREEGRYACACQLYIFIHVHTLTLIYTHTHTPTQPLTHTTTGPRRH